MITTNYNLKHFLCEAGGNILDVCATVYIDYLKKLKESEPSKIEEGSNLLRIFFFFKLSTVLSQISQQKILTRIAFTLH